MEREYLKLFLNKDVKILKKDGYWKFGELIGYDDVFISLKYLNGNIILIRIDDISSIEVLENDR